MGLQNCIQDFHMPLIPSNGLWEGVSLDGGIGTQGLLGLQAAKFWWIPIWCEAETATTRARRDEIKHLWIIQDLQAEDKDVLWLKATKIELLTRSTCASLQFKTQALVGNAQVKMVSTLCDKRCQAIWSNGTHRSNIKWTKEELDREWTTLEGL